MDMLIHSCLFSLVHLPLANLIYRAPAAGAKTGRGKVIFFIPCSANLLDSNIRRSVFTLEERSVPRLTQDATLQPCEVALRHFCQRVFLGAVVRKDAHRKGF